MSRLLYTLLLAIPATFIAEALHASSLVVFVLAALALVPLAGLIGSATEAIAEHLGQSVGGLLNATFGNAAEIIIGLAALGAGLPDVVRASLSGSIIGNSLLVLGTSMLIGGWRYRRQEFSQRVAGQYSSMLVLAVVGMAIPSLLATVGTSGNPGNAVARGYELYEISVGVSIVLLICYAAYIAYSVFGLRAYVEAVPDVVSSIKEEHEEEIAVDIEERARKKGPLASKRHGGLSYQTYLWRETIWFPVVILGCVTAATAFLSEILVGTIEPLTHDIGLNPFFVGLIIIPIVGNAAEHTSAINSAVRNHMEISMAITAGSSIQVALLAAPLLVLASIVMGTHLSLNFTLLEVTMFGLVTILYALISLDGISTWLEGLLLCAFYLMLAVGTFFTPA